MIIARLTIMLAGLCLVLVLSACSSVSGAVADHWPHWAGGLPAGVPPRPGEPGYEEFIAHQQTETQAVQPAAVDRQPSSRPEAATGDSSSDASAARGGLY